MKILVINAGSSSLKYQLIDTNGNELLAKGLCERIGIDGRLKYTNNGHEQVIRDIEMNDHADAIKVLIEVLTDKGDGVINSMDEITAIGHRVVHGGEKFSQAVLISDEVMKAIEDCVDLAPLHNPPNITGIRACANILPNTPQVAVFDTAFHQTMPKEAYLYAIPYEFYEKYKIRRYGFHGTSHKYVAQRAAAMLGKPLEELNIITLHLGNGASVAAVKNGKSIDTSMGFTPLSGVIMGTRSGDIDPDIVRFVAEKEWISAKKVSGILNKNSGMLGISGVSSDFRDIEAGSKEGNERCKIALDMFVYSVKKFIGAYAAAMGGVDAVVFTAGVGENNKEIRTEIMQSFEFLGFEIDEEKNAVRGMEIDISSNTATRKTLVIPTNEELMIALETLKITLNEK